MTPAQAEAVRILSRREIANLNERLFIRRLAEHPDRALDAREAGYLARIAGRNGVAVVDEDVGPRADDGPPSSSPPGSSPGRALAGGREEAETAGAGVPFHPLANLFPLIEGEAFEELVASIRENGQREPIILLDGRILDGRNRYRACLAAGVAPRLQPLGEGVDPLRFVIDHNLRRRHLTDDQRRMVAARIANLGRGEKPDGNTPNGGISQAEAREMLAVDERGVERARTVVTKGAEELQEAVDSRKLTVRMAADLATLPIEEQREIVKAANPKALREIVRDLRAERQAGKRDRRETREAELGKRQAALPGKRYGVILADPEWRFEPYSRETGMDRAADNHYPTSDLDAIMARPVGDIAAPDCALFLWATVPMLPQALRVMEAWGFAYVSHIVWRKAAAPALSPNRHGGLVLGTGYWFRNGHELLLLGTRGQVPAPAPGDQWPSMFDAPPMRHSQKPAKAYDLIEAYFPSLPKIELNARARRDGWDAWGLEAPDVRVAQS